MISNIPIKHQVFNKSSFNIYLGFVSYYTISFKENA